jgi:TolB-like protein/tetratricopeptide (TPR) repeat protein
MEANDRGSVERLKALFDQAVEAPPGRREEVLEAACADDQALRQEVLSLLASDAAAGDFLEQPAACHLALSGDAWFPSRLQPGHQLGRYEIVSFVGAGAVSEVYRAHDARLGRTVALKLLTDTTAHDGAAWLLKEAQHASTLSHPHICTVHEVDEWEGRPFIVLEHIEGHTLHAARRQGPLPLETIVRWGAEIADALDHAHRRGVVHRDLKSSNVVITLDQQVKLLDFGLARRLEGAGSHQAASVLADASVAGTLTHIAPEVLAGGPADARVDIWALGVLLYELAAGCVPFQGATSFATASAILEESPAPLPRAVPPALRQIIARCLSKDPATRWASAGEVRDALRRLARDMGVGARRSRTARGALAVALVAVVAAAAAYVARPWPGAARDPASGPRAVVAVLPVVEPGGDASQRLLPDGITEGVIAELGRIDAIRVIAPSSTRRFVGQPVTPPEVGRETGAAHVLSATLTRNGDRVRLAARLADVASGRVLWSSDYERGTRQLQALYGVMARDVAGAIAVQVRPDDAERLTRIRAVDPDVYEAYLKGRYYWNQRTAESLRTAVGHYETAIRLDPTYAPAYAALADCYNLLGTQMVGGGSPREWRPKAAEAAIRALQIDSGLAEAHAALGYVRHYNWEWAAAEQSFQLAIALNPSYPLARIWYANLLSSRNRVDEALAQATAAGEIDPLSPVVGTNIGWLLIHARRFSEAIAALQSVVARDPGYVQAHSRLASAYAFSGRLAEAVAEAETANRLAGDSVATRATLAQTLALAGRREEAGRLLAQLLQERARQYVPPGAIGNIYAALGRADEAIVWLARSHEERTNNNAYLAVEPIHDSVRADPRFEALVRATGLR